MGACTPKVNAKTNTVGRFIFWPFQGVMLLFAYLGGVAVFPWLGNFTHWIASILLGLIGLKMIYEATISEPQENPQANIYSHLALLLLAIATSIAALAAGFTLTLMNVNGFYACILIGVITFVFSYAGVHMGRKISYLVGKKANLGRILQTFILTLRLRFVIRRQKKHARFTSVIA
jgi:putative Mn2+ efflux pump MntP